MEANNTSTCDIEENDKNSLVCSTVSTLQTSLNNCAETSSHRGVMSPGTANQKRRTIVLSRQSICVGQLGYKKLQSLHRTGSDAQSGPQPHREYVTSSLTHRKCIVTQNLLCSTLAPLMPFELSLKILHTCFDIPTYPLYCELRGWHHVDQGLLLHCRSIIGRENCKFCTKTAVSKTMLSMMLSKVS
jgi:hypothetical protein